MRIVVPGQEIGQIWKSRLIITRQDRTETGIKDTSIGKTQIYIRIKTDSPISDDDNVMVVMSIIKSL